MVINYFRLIKIHFTLDEFASELNVSLELLIS